MIKNNVLVGKEGYLYLYAGGQKQFDYLLGEAIVENKSVNNFHRNIENRVIFCEKNEILYRHIVFPSKPLVKFDFLPLGCSNVKSVFDEYYNNNAPVLNKHCIYPLDKLIFSDKLCSVFQKLDTHNSDFGSLEIAKAIFQDLSLNINFDDYIDCFEKKYVKGDLSRMIGSDIVNQECFIKLNPANIYSISNREFLKGNTNDVNIMHNFDSISNKRVLVFGDSFFKGVLRFLLVYFKEVMYIRSEFFHKDIVDSFSPDVVLTGNAERYLSKVKSDSVANNFVMSLYGDEFYIPSKDYLEAFSACLSYRYYNHLYMKWLTKVFDRLHEESQFG